MMNPRPFGSFRSMACWKRMEMLVDRHGLRGRRLEGFAGITRGRRSKGLRD
jgi:hypothetical protein